MIEQRGDRPVLVRIAAQECGEGVRLAGSGDQQQDFPRSPDGPQSHGEPMMRDIRFRAEQAVLRPSGGVRQEDLAGCRIPFATRLVEGNMPVLAEPENGKVEPASGRDRLIELQAFGYEVRRIASQQPNLVGSHC